MKLRFYKSHNTVLKGDAPTYLCIHGRKIWGWDKLDRKWLAILPLLFLPDRSIITTVMSPQKDREISRLEIAVVTGTTGPEELIKSES